METYQLHLRPWISTKAVKHPLFLDKLQQAWEDVFGFCCLCFQACKVLVWLGRICDHRESPAVSPHKGSAHPFNGKKWMAAPFLRELAEVKETHSFDLPSSQKIASLAYPLGIPMPLWIGFWASPAICMAICIASEEVTNSKSSRWNICGLHW